MNRKIIILLIIILTILTLVFIFVSKPNYSFENLSIEQDEWNTLISEKTKSDSLSLVKIEFNDYELIIDENNDKLYYSLVNNSLNKFKPSISYKTNIEEAKIAILKDEIDENKVMNNHEFKIMIYTNDNYKIYNLYCSMLPFLNISFNEEFKTAKSNIPMDVYVFDNLANSTNRVIKSKGRLSISYNSSDEQEYSFSLFVTSPGKNQRGNMISLFNTKPHKEYTLKLPSDDKKGIAVEVFINNEYKGLYEFGFNPNNDFKPKSK